MKNGRLIIGSVAALAVLVLAGTALAHAVVRINGTRHDDQITGTPGNDLIQARGGNDSVNGDGGNDRVWGGVGNDAVTGGDGDDVVRGRPGDDTLDGGNGNDRMFGGRGTDTSMGGEGNDVLHALARDNQKDTLDCGPGTDVAVINAAETLDTAVNCETIKKVSITVESADRQENG
jgi:Ca2+-binding RTX toxin-like protein